MMKQREMKMKKMKKTGKIMRKVKITGEEKVLRTVMKMKKMMQKNLKKRKTRIMMKKVRATENTDPVLN